MKTRILLPAIVLVITGAAAFGAIGTFAQNTQDPQNSLVKKIAQKFGLNENEVQAVFDEQHQEMKAQMQARFEEKLTQAVSEGKLTEEQKQLIIAKHAELEKQRESNRNLMKNLSEEEMKTKMDEEKTSLEAWAKENNIDMQYLFGGMHKGKKVIFKMR